MDILRTEHLQKDYQVGDQAVRALAGVDFTVTQGEFVAIMGPSGSGKSTFLHLIGGLDQPSEGDVILADQPLSMMNDNEVTLVRRRNIGFVFQFYNLVPTLSAEENISLPLLIDGKNIQDYQEHINSLLDLVGIIDRRDHKPDQLSGGEQQRVALARALVTEPAIVLADEPTGNLDSKTGSRMMALLRKSCDELGQTLIIVTHDARAAAYADRIVFLRDGAIVQEIQLETSSPFKQRIALVMETLESLEA